MKLSSYLNLIGRMLASFLVISLWVLSSCSGGEKPPFEYMPHMMDSPAIKAQEYPMPLPPAGTIDAFQQAETYPYSQDQGDLAGLHLSNPLTRSKDVLLRGQKIYNTYCIVCHGEKGKGDGPVIPKFPRPPSLNDQKVRSWSDGRIYHVIAAGQNNMPSYASQIFPEDRWAIVHYIRVLQRAANPTEQDLQKIKQELGKSK